MLLKNTLFCVILFFTSCVYACSFNITSLNFGSYSRNNDSDINAVITISSCNKNQQLQIGLTPGSSGSYGARKMQKTGRGNYTLIYNLYRNPPRTEIWGNGSNGTFTVNQSIKKNEVVNVNIYGKLPAKQPSSPVPGEYVDTITVIFNY